MRTRWTGAAGRQARRQAVRRSCAASCQLGVTQRPLLAGDTARQAVSTCLCCTACTPTPGSGLWAQHTMRCSATLAAARMRWCVLTPCASCSSQLRQPPLHADLRMYACVQTHMQVYRGRCLAFEEDNVVAVKRLDLDTSWDLVRRFDSGAWRAAAACRCPAWRCVVWRVFRWPPHCPAARDACMRAGSHPLCARVCPARRPRSSAKQPSCASSTTQTCSRCARRSWPRKSCGLWSPSW
jgi:hypothetical protein